jgi:Holliday junction resolvase RusA-like endonuclease
MVFRKKQVLLKKIPIKPFIPLTSSTKKIVARKMDLRDRIKAEISDLNKIRERCDGKLLSVDVCFYLNNATKEEGRSKKDLDNMMKIVCDVLAKQMVKNNTETEKAGLGLVNDDSEIREIHCTKKFVDSPEKEGLEIEILRWKEKTKN